MVALSMTMSDPIPGFKVTLQFEGDYLANDACYTSGNMTSRGFLSDS